MVSAQTRVKPNAGDVAAKVIDGEAIIMNLSNGLYYSMEHVGAAIWALVAQGRRLDQVAGIIVDRYGIDRERAADDLQRLVTELLDENLVVVAEPEGDHEPALPDVGEQRAYVPPVLLKYTDMADLLALDPPMPNVGNGANGSR